MTVRTFIGLHVTDDYDPADDLVPEGPADGCNGAPWCGCWTCERVNPPHDNLDLEGAW